MEDNIKIIREETEKLELKTLHDIFNGTHIPCSCLQHTSFISSYCSKLAFALLNVSATYRVYHHGAIYKIIETQAALSCVSNS